MGRRKMMLAAAGTAVAMFFVAACGDDDDNGDTNGVPQDQATAANGDTTGDDPPAETGNGGSGGGGATLTIGDNVYTVDNPYCAFGPEETQNDRVSFSSGGFTEVDGVRAQLDASIQDPSEEGRYTGEGTIHSVTLNDIEDFENPSVAWAAVTGILGGGSFEIQVDGKNVRAEAVFDDERTPDEIEEIPGTLEMTCR